MMKTMKLVNQIKMTHYLQNQVWRVHHLRKKILFNSSIKGIELSKFLPMKTMKIPRRNVKRLKNLKILRMAKYYL